MKRTLNQTPTKTLPQYPDTATLKELFDAACQKDMVNTFGYQRNGKRVYVSIVGGDSACRAYFDNVVVHPVGSPELKDAVRREVRRQIKLGA